MMLSLSDKCTTMQCCHWCVIISFHPFFCAGVFYKMSHVACHLLAVFGGGVNVVPVENVSSFLCLVFGRCSAQLSRSW